MDETHLKEFEKLLKARSSKQFSAARTNFEIGRLVYNAFEEGGEDAVRELAARFSSGSATEGFFFDAMRVYRTIKNPGFLRELKKKLGGNLSWGFLVSNCTKAPEGESEEAMHFWERRLRKIEEALGDVEDLLISLEGLPPRIREQVEGLLLSASDDLALDNGEREILEGPIKFGHIGDIQMSEELTSAGRVVIDPETGKNERLLDIKRCLDFAIEKMIEADCQVAILSGDIYDRHNPSPNEIGCVRTSTEKAAEHMPVIAISGNHDISRNPKDASAIESMKGWKNVYVVEKPEVLYLEGKEIRKKPSETWPQPDCAKIFCLPFPSRAMVNGDGDGKSIAELNALVSDKLRVVLETFRLELDPDVPNILIAHVTVGGADGATNSQMLMYDPSLYPTDLSGFDYVALGHIHKFQQVTDRAYYGGSIERCDFNEEHDPKGFVIGALDGKKLSVEFVETPARVFETISPEFFDDPDWEQKVDPRILYRIKGEVSPDEYEVLKTYIRQFPVPLNNKLSVRREVVIRDKEMTEELSEDDALKRFLTSSVGLDEAMVENCLREHHALAKGDA